MRLRILADPYYTVGNLVSATDLALAYSANSTRSRYAVMGGFAVKIYSGAARG